MIRIHKFQDGKELNLIYATVRFVSYGHFNIEVEFEYRGNFKTLESVTTDAEGIVLANDLGEYSWKDKAVKLYDIISHQIDKQVSDWIQDIDWELDNN